MKHWKIFFEDQSFVVVPDTAVITMHLPHDTTLTTTPDMLYLNLGWWNQNLAKVRCGQYMLRVKCLVHGTESADETAQMAPPRPGCRHTNLEVIGDEAAA